jgi:hypothetical protein
MRSIPNMEIANNQPANNNFQPTPKSGAAEIKR